MRKPLAIDLFCGLGGWAEGFLAQGYDVVGFDIERHVYGEHKYPAQLVIQDVLMLHGSQFRDAAVIVASPPCQAYSYRAMPWKRAKALPAPDNSLFQACFCIQMQASEAAGRYIPLVIENVKGAQPWIGSARWHFGSFYLWGDVPALMPMTLRTRKSRHIPLCETPAGVGSTSWFHGNSKRENRFYGVKNPGQDWSRHALTGETSPHWNVTATRESRSQAGGAAAHSSRSSARKQASALIAKIPFELSSHIARCFYPRP